MILEFYISSEPLGRGILLGQNIGFYELKKRNEIISRGICGNKIFKYINKFILTNTDKILTVYI